MILVNGEQIVVLKSILIAVATLSLSPVAHAQISDVGDPDAIAAEFEQAETAPVSDSEADPWEGFNRKMFATHMFLDETILVPAAKAYRATTHKKARKGIRNLLANARSPVILINDLLQGEFGRAGDTAGRFLINTTIGFGGMGDPAERMGIQQHSEDFGQTMAVWGVEPGPYLFLPLFGPSSIRDGFGAAIDVAMEPTIWIRTDAAQYARSSRAGATALALREPLIEPLEDIQEKSLDFYASFRSFYLQSRKREIANGRTNYDDLPDIGEFEEFDDLE